MLQAFTNHLIQSQEVVCRDTFSIRRIGNDDTLFLRLFKLLESLDLQFNILAQSGCLHVTYRYFIGLRVIVITINLMRKFTFVGVIVIDGIEQVLIEVIPFFKSKLLAEHTGSDVACYQCRFDGYGARTAHRVNQVALTLPSCHQDHPGCQHFIQRSFYRFLAIATTMERFSRTVERQRTTVFGDVYIE